MTNTAGIYSGTVALYGELSRIIVSVSKTECFSHHVFRNNIRNNGTGLLVVTNYYIFQFITRINTILQHSIDSRDELFTLQYITVVHT